MKARITFVHDPEDAFDPSQLQVRNETLVVNNLTAAREVRITLGLQELPQEVWRALKQCHELHIRWSSAKPYSSISPFNARISPGLHAFFTPLRNRSADLLCPLLQKVFGEDARCISPESTFTALTAGSQRFSTSAAFQYYQLLPSLDHVATYLQHKICPELDDQCLGFSESLRTADYADIDFDTISQALTLTTVQHKNTDSKPWYGQISTSGASARVEVGVLANEKPIEPEELSLGGFLTVVGEDDEPSPTLFSFPARHHDIPGQSYMAEFLSPTGLHPTLRLTFDAENLDPPSLGSCALHSYSTLPSTLFPDKYQLSSPLFLKSKGLKALRSVSGETDLEAPVWAVDKWGSAMLVEISSSYKGSPCRVKDISADIPLHLRYYGPSSTGIAEVEIPWPIVFWACTAEEGTKMTVNPFDRVNLGYEGLFGPKTMFYHLKPKLRVGINRGRYVESLFVPVLQTETAPYVEPGTILVILLGFGWVLWKLSQATFSHTLQKQANNKRSQ